MPVARILGIEVRLQLGWILVVALVATIATAQATSADPTAPALVQWLLGGVVALGFLLSATAHDMSHALIARRRGVEVGSIVISFFGGATPLDPASPNPGDELAIAVGGPAASIAIGAVLALGAAALGTVGTLGSLGLAAAQVLAVLAVLNLLVGFVNVIPAYPLDGGRIVRALAWRRSGAERDGWRAAASTGRAVAVLVVLGGAALIGAGEVTNGAMIALCGWFLLLSSRAIRERVKMNDLIGDLTVGDVMERDAPTVHPGLTVDILAAQLLDGDVPTTAIAVLSDDQVVGIVGVRQVRRLRRAAWATSRAEDVMVRPPRLPIVRPGERLIGAVERLQRAGLDGLPVVDGGALVGILTRLSIGQAVQARMASPR